MSPAPAGPRLSSQMEKLTSRVSRSQLLLALTVGTVLATGFLGSFFIQAPWQQQRRILENRYAEEVRRSELLTALNGLIQRLDSLEQQILLQGGTPVLTSEVTRLATTSGLQIESVAPKPEIRLSAYRTLQIEVRASAAFNNLLLFLRALETQQPLFLVSELEIQRSTYRSSTDASYPGAYSAPTPYAVDTTGLNLIPPVEELDPERQNLRIVVAAFSQAEPTP